jgi:predicted DNA-binding antitoxin AbrB/MazE fold protein
MSTKNPQFRAAMGFFALACYSMVAGIGGKGVQGVGLSGAADPADRPVAAQKGDAAKKDPDQQKRIHQAIERGLAYLRRTQLPTGSWIIGRAKPAPGVSGNAGDWLVGFAALPGLTLLECGVPAADPAVQRAAKLVRLYIPNHMKTYEISLAILFLDRLGEAQDRPLIRTLALRLAGGQTHLGGWSYVCPLMNAAQEKKLLKFFRDWKPADEPPPPTKEKDKDAKPPSKNNGTKPLPKDSADNSNTQFAILALWKVRNLDLPLDYTMAQVEKRFRSDLHPSVKVIGGKKLIVMGPGWGYTYGAGGGKYSGSMTCVGLLGLAVGRGSNVEAPLKKNKVEPAEDAEIQTGIRILIDYMAKDPHQDFNITLARINPRQKYTLDYYFLWSVQRVGVLLNLKTIGGRDWYDWGIGYLLPEQLADGSWLGGNYSGNGLGNTHAVSTCFALLFLKRSDLLPDLREILPKRVKIVDPGASSKSLGDKSDSPPKKPDDKGDSPEKKTAPPKSLLDQSAVGAEPFSGARVMSITVEATYENGILKLEKPLHPKEHEKVRVTVHSETSPILEAYGIMGFKGGAEQADHFALDAEFDPQEDSFTPPAISRSSARNPRSSAPR